MNDQLQMSRWYVNKGIDSLIFWKAIPFIGTKHLKAWHLVTPVSRRASLREQRRLQFHRQKMWSIRGCDCRTVTEKKKILLTGVIFLRKRQQSGAPWFYPIEQSDCTRTDFYASRLINASWHCLRLILWCFLHSMSIFTCVNFILFLNYNVVRYIKFEELCVCLCVCLFVCCMQ